MPNQPLTDDPASQPPANDRRADSGHYNQYGMRDDPREASSAREAENPGTGEGARRFGAGGDEATYENRDLDAKRTEGAEGPIAQVSAGGSARELGLDYGGERHQEPPLSSRQGAELIQEKRGVAPKP